MLHGAGTYALCSLRSGACDVSAKLTILSCDCCGICSELDVFVRLWFHQIMTYCRSLTRYLAGCSREERQIGDHRLGHQDSLMGIVSQKSFQGQDSEMSRLTLVGAHVDSGATVCC